MRGIVEQIARGLRAFHRLEMLHQDLRPENLLIDAGGTLKIIDFGSTRVAGIAEAALTVEQPALLGTALYSAPEYFLGEHGSVRSDLYSLGVIAYQLLSGRFPYGTEVARAKTAAAQRRLAYRSVLDDEREIPAWIDDTLKKALQPNPYRRYAELSEFLYDLRHPSPGFLNKSRPPLMERDPVLFWKGVSLALSLAVVFLLVR
ncbi:protein kinase [Marinobacterium aestuariivivens]|uniref:non-specific serine/threonine protein kinase n=1 Tax=Marinobacterium aestuariivivens TaxID=1698799 RepID=A0ABW1ZW77_9GAMM